MPTILTHPAVPLALGLGLGPTVIPGRLLAAGAVASVVPDLDVIAFEFGVPYGSAFGHRGFTHSLPFAALVALLGACFWRVLRARLRHVFWFLFIATASHGTLDAFTTGGSGIAFLWPWSTERYFAPVQVIEVSPIGVARFLSQRGLAVLRSELFWIWLPCTCIAGSLMLARWRESRPRSA